MFPCYAGKNEIVCRVGYQNPIHKDVHIAMSAFRHKPVADEHCFCTSGLLGMLRRHNIWQKVQRFSIAMEKACILNRQKLNRFRAEILFLWFYHHP